ncbi:MAG TPA: M28 family metallopeptidase [Myxococcota bacterium]|nr:M28 family metallopeptidase [Myxococcota bacterium]
MIRLIFLFAIVFEPLLLQAHDFSSSVDKAVAAIDMEQWYEDTKQLASFNRFYRSPEINLARDWLVEKFSGIGLTTSIEEITIRGQAGFNVVAEISGRDPNDIYLVGAHYDSISEKAHDRAPGAEDNASGTAGLLALARAFMAEPEPKSRIRFVAFSGEEAGLHGSKAHVANIFARREQDKIKEVLIMDMIGYTSDDDLDALIETSSSQQNLVDLLRSSANKYSQGRIETSFNYWGSDHVPFINNGFSAALLIENDYNEYPHYHRSTDVPANLRKEMAEVILKMIAGALGYWVL